MFMTAKVDLKKILFVIGLIALVIIGAIWLLGDTDDAAATAVLGAANNDQRVKYLRDFGWDVTNTPVETGQVKIPEELKINIELIAKLKDCKTVEENGKLKQLIVYQDIDKKIFKIIKKLVRKLNRLKCVGEILVNCGDDFKENVKNEE